MDTLALNPQTWDLTVDTQGNIAVATGNYAIAQDVACAARLFRGELWYDTSQGLPYFEKIMFQNPPPASFLNLQYVTAGLGVPGTVAITPALDLPIGKTRVLTGKIGITTDTGVSGVVTLGQPAGLPFYSTAADPVALGVPTG